MEIYATHDVPNSELAALAASITSVGPVVVRDARALFKSAEPPSWISLIEQAPIWLKILGGPASLWAAGFFGEAGKESWQNRSAIAKRLRDPATRPLRSLVEAIKAFRMSVRLETDVDIGLPYPDDHFGTKLRLNGRDTELLTAEIALFVHHLPRLVLLLKEIAESGDGIIGGISLSLDDDGSLVVVWMGRESLEQHTRVLRESAP